MWSACPVCMTRIEAVVAVGSIQRLSRNYGPAARLPSTFAARFKATVGVLHSVTGSLGAPAEGVSP